MCSLKEISGLLKPAYTARAHYSLGLFLAQYLCNGFNLVDAGELTYSQYYFDTGRRAFKFKRTKTTNRTEGGSEVIIPIIKPLQNILDEIAAKPELNAFVFPDILQEPQRRPPKKTYGTGEFQCAGPCGQGMSGRAALGSQAVRHLVPPFIRHEPGHAHVEEKYISESMATP